MKIHQIYTGIGAAAGMLILILDGKTALLGAREGLELVIGTVIPSLFPFFFLSTLLTGSLMGSQSSWLRPVGRLFGLPKGAESLLIPAFLGGYPSGAQSVASAAEAGQIAKEDAARMLAFCNNAGPSFLFGMAGSLFPETWMVWALWAIHIGGAQLASRFFPCGTEAVAPRRTASAPSPAAALGKSLTIMATVSGWVILFRVLIAFLDRWVLWLLPEAGQALVSGLLELANGICRLPDLESTALRFVLCSVLLALGGVCVAMQTASVTKDIPGKYYLPGKVIQALYSFAVSAIISSPYRAAGIAVAVLCLLFPGKSQKRSSNQAVVGV